VGKPDLGTKRTCPSCGTKYYDLNRSPIVCPSCGTVFQVTASQRAPERVAAPKAAAAIVPAVVVEREEGVVSLEDVEEPDADIGPDADEADETVVADVEVEGEDIRPAADDTFLEAEEEEGDVTVLLDVDAEDEDER